MLMIFGLTTYLTVRIWTIYSTREYEYKKRDLIYTKEQMRNMNLTFGQFDKSMNFIFGFDFLPEDFYVLNNPYFDFTVRLVTFEEGLKTS